MIRRLGGVVVIVALVGAAALPAFGSTRNYADDFSSGGYAGSTGSTNWDTTWQEVGESNGPSSGSVTVDTGSFCDSGDCLVIEALIGGIPLGAQRRIDMTGAVGAILSYKVDFPGGLLISGTAVVDARADNGSWVTLATHGKGTDDEFEHVLPAATNHIDIRFRATGLALGAEMGFDSVEVDVEVAIATTTSTTTSSTTTTTTRPPLTIPTTITLPPILPTTTTSTTTTTTTAPSDTETTSTTRREAGDSSTTTTRPDRDSTTSTTRPSATTTTEPPASTTSTTVPEDSSVAPTQPPPPPPSETFGVITRLDPGITGTGGLDLMAQDRLLVRFVRASEKISFDILMNLALGIILAWASLSTMQRKGG